MKIFDTKIIFRQFFGVLRSVASELLINRLVQLSKEFVREFVSESSGSKERGRFSKNNPKRKLSEKLVPSPVEQINMWEVIGDWIPIILLFILLFVFILSILFFLQKEGVFLSLFSSQYSSANYPFQVWVTLWFNEVLYWFGLGTSYSLPFLHSHFASSPEILAYLDSLGMGKKQKKRQEVTVSDRVVMRTLSMLWLEEPKLNLFGRAHLQVCFF